MGCGYNNHNIWIWSEKEFVSDFQVYSHEEVVFTDKKEIDTEYRFGGREWVMKSIQTPVCFRT